MTITQSSVLDALKALLYSASQPPDTSLTHLLLVDYLLTDPALPDTSHKRRIALNRLLTTTIRDALTHFRRIHHLTVPSAEHDLAKARCQITDDAATQSAELLTVSWMYYRYVRVDLDITPDTYSAWAGVDDRTLRRYHKHGVKRLTDTLIHREWRLGQEQRKLRLLTALPVTRLPHLYGRDLLLQHIEDLLPNAQPHHLQITGAPGIGKTALTHEVVRRLIDQHCLDDLIWFDEPESIRCVYDRLEALATPVAIRDYLLRYRVMVVIDNAHQLDLDRLNAVLKALSTAYVIVVNRHYLPLSTALPCVAVPPIPEADAKTYIRAVNESQYPGYEHRLSDQEVDRLWREVGGHPIRIRQTITALWEALGEESA